MDPTKQFLTSSPRNLTEDAFFTSDRSSTNVSRDVTACDLPRKASGTCTSATPLTFTGWRNRFPLSTFTAVNPLPQERKTAAGGGADPSIRGWTHDVAYTSFASHSTTSMATSARVRVAILFGTGSEAYRHGLCSVVDAAAQPTILIIVPGIEPSYVIKFKNPATGETKSLAANNRWGVGITEESIKAIVAQHVSASIGYDVVVCAAYSTGHYGLSGSINSRLFSFLGLERAVAFDCLYNSFGKSLYSLAQAKPSARIVAYVASPGGNDFRPGSPPSFNSLSFGNKSFIHYVNLFMNPNYYAAAAARLIGEAVPPAGNPILTVLPKLLESALDDVLAHLPARGSIVSDSAVFQAVKGSLPSNATPLSSFAAANASQVMHFFSQVGTIRACIENAQLLGWPALPLGEEWHDMLLIEFAWEYLVLEVDPVGRLAPADEDRGHHLGREQSVGDDTGRR